MNNNEKEIYDVLSKKGWNVLTKGWPDFLVMSDDMKRGFALELKSRTDTLDENQKKMHMALAAFGIMTMVAKYDDAQKIIRKSGRELFTLDAIENMKYNLQELKYEIAGAYRNIEKFSQQLDAATAVFEGSPVPLSYIHDPLKGLGLREAMEKLSTALGDLRKETTQ